MAQQIQGAVLQALIDLGSDIVTPQNFAAVVKLSTDLERQSMEAEAKETISSEELREQAEDDPLTAALKEDMDSWLF